MLKPKFKEGTALTIDKCVEISLPEDDPDAMLAICQTMHAQCYKGIPDLRNLYETCDKYDTTGVMAPLAQMWIQDSMNKLRGPDCEDDLHLLLDVAIGFRLRRLVSRIGRELVKQALTPIHDLGSLDVADHSVLTAQLEIKRTYVKNTLYQTREEAIERLHHLAFGPDDYCPVDCALPGTLLSSFLGDLRSAGLWPHRAFNTNNIKNICQKMNDVEVYSVPMYHHTCKTSSECIEVENEPWADVRVCLKEATAKATEALREFACVVDERGRIVGFEDGQEGQMEW